MANSISKGYQLPNYKREYRPHDPVKRDAMAAFMARYMTSYGNISSSLKIYNYQAPSISPFRDINPRTQFYKEMCFIKDAGITTGYADRTYRPYENVKRDAMAAFLYRMAGTPSYTAPGVSPFRDITPRTKFYKEMCWLHDTGISTGYPDKTYRPGEVVRRDAMAAFLHRLYEGKGKIIYPHYVDSNSERSGSIYSAYRETVGQGKTFTEKGLFYMDVSGSNPTTEGAFYKFKGTSIFETQVGLRSSEDTTESVELSFYAGGKLMKRVTVVYRDLKTIRFAIPSGAPAINIVAKPLKVKSYYTYVVFGNTLFHTR